MAAMACWWIEFSLLLLCWLVSRIVDWAVQTICAVGKMAEGREAEEDQRHGIVHVILVGVVL